MARKYFGVKLVLFSLLLAPALMAASATIEATAHVEPNVGTIMVNDTLYIMDSWNIYPAMSGRKNMDVSIEYTDSTMTITIIPVSI